MGQLLELGSCLYAVVGASVVAWGIWRAWVRPRNREAVRPTEQRPAQARWSVRGELARLFLVQDEAGETVSHSQVVMSPAPAPIVPDGADRQQTDEVSKGSLWIERLQLDKTRAGWVELMVYMGYTVGDIRGLLKGDNGAIGTEIEAARKRLGMGPSAGYQTPVAGRPTDAKFQDALN
jgi:hypothetical protein